MDNKILEEIITNAIQIGVINTLSNLNLISEVVTEQQARKTYGKRLIDEWRSKRWITAYPSGNSNRSKYYFKRSELDTASRMLSIQNLVSENVIFNKLKYPK